jgi:hypothetical protein
LLKNARRATRARIEKEKHVNTNFWNSLRSTFLVMMLVLTVGLGAEAQSKNHRNQVRTLVGSWAVQVTIADCTTGAPLGHPFSSFLTFAPGGVETDTTANPMFYPAERSPGHGVWGRVDSRNFSTSSTAFITLNGALVKTQKITQAVHMDDDRNSFTSAANVEFFDPSGNLLASGCATAAAQRLQ